ncbi:MAG: WhiB family transcriptional regulator [Thermocrispum sp.]
MHAKSVTTSLEAVVAPQWAESALCAQTDPELFFPERGQIDVLRAAKRVCAECPLQVECREYAIQRGEPFGVWGGTTERERRRIRTERRKAAA